MNTYLNLVKWDGTLALVGVPEEPISIADFNVILPRPNSAEADGSLTCNNGNGGRLPPGFRCHSGFAVQIYAGIEDVASRKSWRNH